MTVLSGAKLNHYRALATEGYFDNFTREKKRAVLHALRALLAHADAIHAAQRNTQPSEGEAHRDQAAFGGGRVASSESESLSEGRSSAGERAHSPNSPARGAFIPCGTVCGIQVYRRARP